MPTARIAVRTRIEHVFGYMSQTMKSFYLRYIGKRRNHAAIGYWSVGIEIAQEHFRLVPILKARRSDR